MDKKQTLRELGIKEHMVWSAASRMNEEFPFVFTEFNYMDVFGFDRSGVTCEIEIKVADYDLYKEFTKQTKIDKHGYYRKKSKSKGGFCPTRFYFMVPPNLTLKTLNRINAYDWYHKYGVIEFDYKTTELKIVKHCNKLTNKLFTGELLAKPFSEQKTKMVNIPELMDSAIIRTNYQKTLDDFREQL